MREIIFYELRGSIPNSTPIFFSTLERALRWLTNNNNRPIESETILDELHVGKNDFHKVIVKKREDAEFAWLCKDEEYYLRGLVMM